MGKYITVARCRCCGQEDIYSDPEILPTPYCCGEMAIPLFYEFFKIKFDEIPNGASIDRVYFPCEFDEEGVEVDFVKTDDLEESELIAKAKEKFFSELQAMGIVDCNTKTCPCNDGEFTYSAWYKDKNYKED